MEAWPLLPLIGIFRPEAGSVDLDILVDTHAHLDFPQFNKDLVQVLHRARQAGIVAIVNAGTDINSSRKAVKLSRKYSFIGASAGIHPHGAARLGKNWLEEISALANEDNVIAVGETGLDFYRDLSPRDVQEDVFRSHIRLAKEIGKPLIVHTREAHKRTLQVLKEEALHSKPGVMHCFSGDGKMLEAYLELGFYISVAGPVTYPRSEKLRGLLKQIPADRLLLETDAPYLSPQARRSERNEPSFIKYTYERVALLLNRDFDDLAGQVYLNAVRLFSDLLVDRV